MNFSEDLTTHKISQELGFLVKTLTEFFDQYSKASKSSMRLVDSKEMREDIYCEIHSLKKRALKFLISESNNFKSLIDPYTTSNERESITKNFSSKKYSLYSKINPTAPDQLVNNHFSKPINDDKSSNQNQSRETQANNDRGDRWKKTNLNNKGNSNDRGDNSQQNNELKNFGRHSTFGSEDKQQSDNNPTRNEEQPNKNTYHSSKYEFSSQDKNPEREFKSSTLKQQYQREVPGPVKNNRYDSSENHEIKVNEHQRKQTNSHYNTFSQRTSNEKRTKIDTNVTRKRMNKKEDKNSTSKFKIESFNIPEKESKPLNIHSIYF